LNLKLQKKVSGTLFLPHLTRRNVMSVLEKFLLFLKLFAVQSLPYSVVIGSVTVTIALTPVPAPVPPPPAE
jgi:hypothetical protein